MKRSAISWICILMLMLLLNNATSQEEELTKDLTRSQEILRLLNSEEVARAFVPIETRIHQEFDQKRATLGEELRRRYAINDSPKGEFETTTEYQARLRVHEQNKAPFAAEWAQVFKKLDEELSHRIKAARNDVELSLGYSKLRSELSQIELKDYTTIFKLTLRTYNADTERFPITINHALLPDSIEGWLSVPRTVAVEIKSQLSEARGVVRIRDGILRLRSAWVEWKGTRWQIIFQSHWVIGKSLKEDTSWVSSVAFSPDGTRLASGNWDHTVRLWDAFTGKNVRIFKGHEDHVYSVAYSLDGRILASGGEDGTVRLWDILTGKNIQTLRGHRNDVLSVVFSPDRRTLASASEDLTVRLWDIHTGKNFQTFEDYGYIHSVAFSPDGKILASVSDTHSRTILLSDVISGKRLQTLEGHWGPIYSVTFSPDGRTLATASGGGADSTVRLWDIHTGKNFQTFEDYSEIHSVAFSPDGKILASGGADGTVRLWNVVTRKRLQTLEGHTGTVYSVTFSPDGRTLATASGGRNGGGSEDNTIRLWWRVVDESPAK